MNGPPLTAGLWALAAAPVVLLCALVLRGRVSTSRAAGLVLGLAVALAAAAYRADAPLLLAAIGKGLWLGTWVLGVVWPALLLYRVASAVGLDRIGGVFSALLPRRRETLLLLAWLFPSFLQGVAGFGTPIAVAAPLLLAAGWSPVQAVLYPLIGYHWSVTFGSMGSSFYMASLTAHLSGAEQTAFALQSASLLAVNCLVSAVIVLLLDGGWRAVREGARMVVCVGIPMAATLIGTALVVPAVASLAAGAVGFVAAIGLSAFDRLRRRSAGTASAPSTATAAPAVPTRAVMDGGTRAAAAVAVRPAPSPAEPDPTPHHAPDRPAVSAPGPRPAAALLALSPYLYLLLTAMPVFVVPASRAWVAEHLVLAPDFPASATGYGWANPPVDGYTPLALLGHPGSYVLLAALLGYLTYRAAGIWPTAPAGIVRSWASSLPRASISVLLLAAVATVMADAGMVSVLAGGAAQFAGDAYPALSPVIGALGSFMTGSTTNSNALFAGLQEDVAGVLGMDAAVLVAAQTAGGNVGNAVAPVVVLIGLTAVGRQDALPAVLRRLLVPAGVLLAVVAVLTVLSR